MEIHGHQIAVQWPSKRRLPWLLLSVAAMFVSAYSVFGWMGAVGRISGWTGLPKYEAQIPQLQIQAEVWLGLAVTLPFVAAWFLGFGRKEVPGQIKAPGAVPLAYPPDSESWLAPVGRYAVRLVISVLGALGLTFCLFVFGLLIHNLKIHSG